MHYKSKQLLLCWRCSRYEWKFHMTGSFLQRYKLAP